MPNESANDLNGESPTHVHPVPPDQLARYSVKRDPYSEQDIRNYVEGEAPDEVVQHVERIKKEAVLDEVYEIWDVTTDANRWWVITNLTNLYSQQHFPSLDYTLSFHIGLMMRLRSRFTGATSDEPTPFDEVFRRQEQAKVRFATAVEGEDFQAVGMLLRECLISLVAVLRRRAPVKADIERPRDADFLNWTDLLINEMCGGASNKPLRKHLKNTAEETWQLANWLTHHRNVNKTAASIAIEATDAVVGHFVQILVRERTDRTEQCPLCKSRDIRSHFDMSIEPDGDYYISCGACEWNSHPNETPTAN